MEKPLISVIIPVYNCQEYLPYCLDSILNQTYSNIEILAINDGSKDASLSVLREYQEKDSRVIVFDQPNGGASAARNVGLKNAKGDYIAFVDADDYIEPRMFEIMYDTIVEHGCNMVECDMILEQGHNHFNEVTDYETIVLSKEKQLDRFFRVNGEEDTHIIWNKLISKDILDGFRFVEGFMNEDVLATYEFARRCNECVYIKTPLYHYYANNEGVTRRHFNVKQLDLLEMWKRVLELEENCNSNYLRYAKINSSRAYFTLLSKMHLNGYDKKDPKMNEIRKMLKKQVRKDFFDLLKWKMPLSRKVLLIYLVILG